MIELRLDLSAFEHRVRELGGQIDQLPFALANAMTSAAFKARERLITDTWPGHIQSRDRNFMRAALRVEKATKRNLRVAINDKAINGRGHLALHAKGGTKPAKKRLAIPPTGSVTRTSRGVSKSQTPRAIINRTPKRALRMTSKGIFVGEKGRLHLKYAFKTSAHIKADVPFGEDFRNNMLKELRTTFPVAMAKAMRSRRS